MRPTLTVQKRGETENGKSSDCLLSLITETSYDGGNARLRHELHDSANSGRVLLSFCVRVPNRLLGKVRTACD